MVLREKVTNGTYNLIALKKCKNVQKSLEGHIYSGSP